MMNMKKILNDYKITIGLVVVAFLIGSWFSGENIPSENVNHNTHSSTSQVWTCSMHPNVQLPESGQCPICFMDLIPLEKEIGSGINPNQLSLSEDAVKLADIETVAAIYGKAEMEIQLSGKIAYDESRIGNITAWVSGRVERMFVDYTGITVNKGDHMIELYSPDLYAAQEELIQARKILGMGSSQSPLYQKIYGIKSVGSTGKTPLNGIGR